MRGLVPSIETEFVEQSPVNMFCFLGSIEGVVGSKHQVPLPARALIVKSSVE